MEIISLPIEFDKKKIDSKYRLAAIAGQRARELALGVKPKLQSRSKKVTTLAIEEAIGDSLEFLTGDEAKKAQSEAKKFDYRKLLEERRKGAPEDLSELEKDLKIYLYEKEAGEKKALEDIFMDKTEETGSAESHEAFGADGDAEK